MDFAIGAIIMIGVPPQHQIPAVAATTVIQAIRGKMKKRHMKKQQSLLNLEIPNEVTLQWSQLTCTLKDKKEGTERRILHEMQGVARPGRLLALLGPSGSGKTTLLNSLAGQLPYTPGMRLSGYITANNQAMPAPGIRSGFVAQEDVFYSQLTVRETLSMAAELRMPKGTSDAQRKEAVDTVIRRLGLNKCAETPVGDTKTRGLSGGEKKRLSIACELIAKPQLIMCDEPTSGLDAFAAERVMSALKELTADGHTIISSIHQPRSSIYEMFDDVCLLSEGQILYFGPAGDALAYFAELGQTCGEHYNPAEFLADLAAIDHTSPEAEEASKARLHKLAEAWKSRSSTLTATGGALLPRALSRGPSSVGIEPESPIGLGRQVALLFNRSWRQVVRDKATAASRAGSQISSALVFSAIYWRMGRGQAAIQDRLGLLQVSAVGTAMSSLIKTLNVFPKERQIVSRERARTPYPVLPYLLSKLAAELPMGAIFPALFGALVYPSTGLNPDLGRFARFLGILTMESFSSQALGLAVGAAAPSTEAALAIGPAIILVSIVFGGLFVNESSVPTALSWAPKTSLIKQAFEGMCVNEFQGLELEADANGRGDTSGEQVLKRLAFKHKNVGSSIVDQGRILLFYWYMTYCVLKAKKAKYQVLEAPEA